MKNWQIAIDTGGTFTDCIATDPEGSEHRLKVLSSGKLRSKIVDVHGENEIIVGQNWGVRQNIFSGYKFRLLKQQDFYSVEEFSPENCLLRLASAPIDMQPGDEFEITADEEAPVLAARLLTETPLHDILPQMDMRLGSTRGTNALLEKKGTAPVLIITKGFADLPLIGDQQRPDLFSLRIEKPSPIFSSVIEVNERIDTHGEIVKSLSESEINKALREIYRLKPKVVVVAFLNSFVNPTHEKTFANLLRTAGIKYVTASHELERSIKFLSRLQTSLVNGYLEPVMFNYLQNISKSMSKDSRLRVMTSGGGLVSATHFHPKDSLLSGPAGGVSGAATVAQKLGRAKILAFDMGGTSTDVSRYAGEFDFVFETKVGEQTIMSPSLYIETVAAGGGSICSYDGFKFTVGPESAGADPGPACYANGGPLSVTDINLLAGRMNASQFGIPINSDSARESLKELKTRHKLDSLSDEEILKGFLDIANEKMAKAIEKISLQRGFEPKEYSLLAFGGAGGMHACAIAEILGTDKAIIPYDAGILSAYGIRFSNVEKIMNKQVLRAWDSVKDSILETVNQLIEEGKSQLQSEGISEDQTEVARTLLMMRFKGQDDCLELGFENVEKVRKQFRENYENRYGHFIEDRELELESIRVIVREKVTATRNLRHPDKSSTTEPFAHQESLVQGQWVNTPVYSIADMQEGDAIKGPSIIINKTSTSYLNKGWEAVVNANKDLLLEQVEKPEKLAETSRQPEQVQLELFTNRFRSVAEDMGALLQRTSFSVNIKERLDFSCALLDAQGYLVVNAPHIPVHLGALGICTRRIMEEVEMQEGDIVVTNHPGYGGSHLPDVTMIAPVFVNNRLVAYVANRAHHAEIGGISPGSMPATARNLEEEGVVIPPVFAAKAGKVNFDEVIHLLTHAKYPTRSLQENIADLEASVASVRKGINQVVNMCRTYGSERVMHYMKALAGYSGNAVEKTLQKLVKHPLTAKEKLDDGSVLSVWIGKNADRIIIDFEGTSPQHPVNLNATTAIVQSVVLYVLRLLINENIPLNEGLLNAVDIKIPSSLLNPDFSADPVSCPAVVGGNVEVSQRLVDTLLKAFGIAACSQGTMNNLLFGNDRFGFYETICGGVGAVEGRAGASAVHQHMTNTRITDPEIMELRYPIRVEKFAIRSGSGGAGKWNGGEGVIRQIRFLEPVKLTVLTQHRKEMPYGMAEGHPGKCGRQYILRQNNEQVELEGIETTELQAFDAIVIETPGGGGYGNE